ncbi:AAA family ATPase [archaeon]|jgi:circadian clock protein KaiC|nr:AAA family ATPase [archaeon]MBT4397134.1 AAA family ATPase [archaeon]MBT4441560.1 AAA family ATPase [archaeon]
MGKVERVATNIPGFDKMIDGGFVKNSLNLVSGGPGTGKTIFAMQFLLEGVKVGQKGLFISFEEEFDNLMGDAMVFGWDFRKLEKQEKCFFFTCKPMEEPNLQMKISEIIKGNKITRVVIDSISVFAMMFKEDAYRIRKEFYKLADFLKKMGCTVLLTSEIPGEAPLDISSGGGSLSRDGIIEFIADSIITVHNSGIGGEGDRAIRVLKMRRTDHTKGPVPMNITKKGMQILD